MNFKKGLVIALLMLAVSLLANDLTRQEYIEKYTSIAIREMQSYGIPASITMAQGILESNNGNSYLAKEANNHFGIKCHDWTGPSVNKDDDTRNECFRKYEHALASFEDHSLFLVNRERYAFLFNYDVDDYKAWAKGLKKAGYATNPKYPQLLIRIIEENELYLLDHKTLDDSATVMMDEVRDHTYGDDAVSRRAMEDPAYRQLQDDVCETENGVRYFVISKDVTLDMIADRFQLHIWEIYRFNDVFRDAHFDLTKGQRVYIETKRRRATKGTPPHQVQPGETMLDIAQLYGIRLKALHRLNRMSAGTQPAPGVLIELVSRKH